MHKRIARTALCAAALVMFPAVSRGTTLLIDDFASKPSSFYIIGTPTPPFHANGKPVVEAIPEALGGERDTRVQVVAAPNPTSAQFSLGVDQDSFPSGVFYVATAGDPASIATLQYDGDDSNPDDWSNAELLDVAISPGSSFEVDFLSIDAPGSLQGMQLTIALTSIGGGTASYVSYAPETDVAATFSAPLVDFLTSPEFDPAHVSSVTFVFNSDALPNVDFVVDNLRVVPEPSSLALAGLSAVAAFGLWRRRRAS